MLTTLDINMNTVSKVEMVKGSYTTVYEDGFDFNILLSCYSQFEKDSSSSDYIAYCTYSDAWYNHSEGDYTLNVLFFTQYDVLSDLFD